MNQANIHDSEVHGDVVLGDKKYEAPLTNLEKAIDIIVHRRSCDEVLVDIFEELAEYLTDNPDREIIGLEKKLEQGKRQDLKKRAIRLKNRFDRKITKKQLSPTVQKVHLQVLSSIITAFESHIRPLIDESATKASIDAAISKHVILPAHKAIVRFNDRTTTEDVSGMLYFLTGKCHLVWGDEC